MAGGGGESICEKKWESKCDERQAEAWEGEKKLNICNKREGLSINTPLSIAQWVCTTYSIYQYYHISQGFVSMESLRGSPPMSETQMQNILSSADLVQHLLWYASSHSQTKTLHKGNNSDTPWKLINVINVVNVWRLKQTTWENQCQHDLFYLHW